MQTGKCLEPLPIIREQEWKFRPQLKETIIVGTSIEALISTPVVEHLRYYQVSCQTTELLYQPHDGIIKATARIWHVGKAIIVKSDSNLGKSQSFAGIP